MSLTLVSNSVSIASSSTSLCKYLRMSSSKKESEVDAGVSLITSGSGISSAAAMEPRELALWESVPIPAI